MPKPSAPDAERPYSDDELTTIFAPIDGAVHVALAVSGGSDSTAMMLLARRWQTSQARPPQFTVLTVDHGLRPEAAAEAAAVALSAAELGFAHATLVWQGEKRAGGIQAAARDARYRLMTDWCRAQGAGCLLTAHTQDDQAETVLMRLARGSGVDGLAGIWPRVEERGVALVRPLLGETRARLRAMLVASGQDWIDDPSNELSKFERVRVRQMIPLLATGGIAPRSLRRTAERAHEAQQALWAHAESFLAASVLSQAEGYAEIGLDGFIRLPRDTRRRVIVRLIERYGGGRREPLSLSGAERVVDIDRWKQPARTFGGCKLVRRKRTLLIGREFGRIDPSPAVVPRGGQLLWDGRFLVRADEGNQIVPLGIVSGTPREARLPAFVQDALPAVRRADGHVAIPHLRPEPGVTAAFAPEGVC